MGWIMIWRNGTIGKGRCLKATVVHFFLWRLSMKRFSLLFLAGTLSIMMSGLALAHPNPRGKALVQMAILLDTSNSMDGLIEQTKSQLWKIANDLQYSTQRGVRPTLEIALFEYGNNRLSPGENYVRQVLPFTSDLDLVSEKLFGLRTSGGSEFAGAVI